MVKDRAQETNKLFSTKMSIVEEEKMEKLTVQQIPVCHGVFYLVFMLYL